MSEIKTIETGRTTLLAVKVPDGASKFYIYEADWMQEEHSLHWRMPDNSDGVLYIDDIENEYEIIGLSTEITEEQARGLVKINEAEKFWDYEDECYFELAVTAREAFESLLQANQINEPVLILKRI